jgi:hypothetical protein
MTILHHLRRLLAPVIWKLGPLTRSGRAKRFYTRRFPERDDLLRWIRQVGCEHADEVKRLRSLLDANIDHEIGGAIMSALHRATALQGYLAQDELADVVRRGLARTSDPVERRQIGSLIDGNPPLTERMPDLIGRLPTGGVLGMVGVTGAGKSLLSKHLIDVYLTSADGRRAVVIEQPFASPAVVSACANTWHHLRGRSVQVVHGVPDRLRADLTVIIPLAQASDQARLAAVRDVGSLLGDHDAALLHDDWQTTASLSCWASAGRLIVHGHQRDDLRLPLSQTAWMQGSHHRPDDPRQRHLITAKLATRGRVGFACVVVDDHGYAFSPALADFWWCDRYLLQHLPYIASCDDDRILRDLLEVMPTTFASQAGVLDSVLTQTTSPRLQAALFHALARLKQRPALLMTA